MSKFSKSLEDFVSKEVVAGHKANVEEVERYVYNQLRGNSPECSGTYRSNHNRSIGQPDYTFIFTKKKGGPCGYANMSSAQTQPSGAKDFDSFFVSNGAPYAKKIEDGHSDQAPSGVYALAYQSAKRKFNL